jgi:hypothetical protein
LYTFVEYYGNNVLYKIKPLSKKREKYIEYMLEVIQVIPTEDYTVYVYFDDGSIKLCDAKEIIQHGAFRH